MEFFEVSYSFEMEEFFHPSKDNHKAIRMGQITGQICRENTLFMMSISKI